MARIPAVDHFAIPSGDVEALAGDDGKKDGRDFRMTAYTGAEFDRWYGRVIVDLTGMEVASDRLPILVEHMRDARAGVSKSARIDPAKGLVVTGRLLDNEHGNALAKDSSQGFPFQASMGVSFKRVEELEDGDDKQVNGRTFRGPGYVVTKSSVMECSFVALGADGSTRAEAFAADAAQTIETVKESKKMSDQGAKTAAADIEAAKKEAADAERARAKAIREALADHPDVALAAIESGDDVTAARARLSVKLAKENADLRGRLEKAEKAAQTPPVGFAGGVREGANTGAAPAEDLSSLPVEERAAKEWSSKPEVRKEFAAAGGKDAYEAYLRAEAEGRVSILEPLHDKFGAAR